MRGFLRLVDTARGMMTRNPPVGDMDALLRALYNSAPFGILIADSAGRCIHTNALYRRMTGFSEAELQTESLQSLSHPDDRPRLQALLRELFDGQQHLFTMIARYRARDGSIHWGRTTLSLHRDDDGTPLYVISRIENLADRRQNKELLRQNEEPFDLLVGCLTDYAIFMLDPDGRVISWNLGAERIEGYLAHEIIGQHFSRFYSREDVERARPERELHQAIEHGRFEDYGWRLRKDGTRFWANVTITPMRTANGILRGFAKVIRDLTEKRTLEERVRKSEQSFRKLVEVLPIAVYVCDTAGRVELHNRRAVDLWGCAPRAGADGDQFSSTDRMYTTDGVHIPPAERPMAEVLRTGNAVIDREIVVERADAQRNTLLVNILPRRDERGNLTGTINCILDITERKRAEHDLKQYTEQLRILSRRLVELHEENRRALSHELHDRVGQNLTALNINLGIVLGQLPDNTSPVIASRLKDSQELVESTVDVITDVMADLRPPLLDDYGLLPALKSIAEQFAQRTGINVEVASPASQERLPRQIELTLCRIAQEALTNVAKHAKAHCIDIKLTSSVDRIDLTVTDDGIGFAPQARGPEQERAGWGMLTMRERAVALGGTLTVNSAPGLGTQVTVTLER